MNTLSWKKPGVNDHSAHSAQLERLVNKLVVPSHKPSDHTYNFLQGNNNKKTSVQLMDTLLDTFLMIPIHRQGIFSWW
jgi:uncharacterized protein YaiL (DUF2058 family)